jgi:hypothetical protein
MSARQKRVILLVVLAEIVLVAIALFPRAAQGDEPALLAQRVEQHLFSAQRSLSSDPAAAHAEVGAAAAQHAALASRLPASAYRATQVAQSALAAAQAAADTPNELAMAQARADYQTALLWAGYLATEAVLDSHGSASSAAVWLKLRSYKPSARYNIASSQATLAVEDLGAGRIQPDAALAIVRRDLDDTYRSLLADALEDCASAAERQFGVRAAEAAALSAGYYRILRAGFAAQAGAGRAAAADRAIADLRAAAAAADWPAVAQARAAVAAAIGV